MGECRIIKLLLVGKIVEQRGFGHSQLLGDAPQGDFRPRGLGEE